MQRPTTPRGWYKAGRGIMTLARTPVRGEARELSLVFHNAASSPERDH